MNAAWSFQNSIWGTDTSGSSQVGVLTINYVATYNSNNTETEIFNLPGITAPTALTEVFLVNRLANGSFQLMNNEGTGSTVNEYTPTAAPGFRAPPGPSSSGPQPMTSSYFWQQGTRDMDSPSYNIVGASTYYTFSGGTYYSTSNTLDIWLYIYTNTGQFIQVTVAWGNVNCGQTATSAPIFSIGYGSSLSNCPSGTAVNGDTYYLGISYYAGSNQWLLSVYDTTNGTFVVLTYVNVSGTYVSPTNFGVAMEGVCSTSTTCPWGMNIPNTLQSFGPNFSYSTQCNPSYTCANNWVNYQYWNSPQSGYALSPPPDLQYYVRAPNGYITQVVWY